MEYIKSISFYFPLSELVCPRAYVFLNWDMLQELSFCFILKKILVCSVWNFQEAALAHILVGQEIYQNLGTSNQNFKSGWAFVRISKWELIIEEKKLWFYQFYLDLIFITAFKNNLTLLRECNWLFVQMYYFSVLPENLMPVKILEQCY